MIRGYHRHRQVFHSFARVVRPSALLLKEVQRMEMLSFDVDLLAEQIDAAITFHVMGHYAEVAYREAHERDCRIKRPFIEIGAHRFDKIPRAPLHLG